MVKQEQKWCFDMMLSREQLKKCIDQFMLKYGEMAENVLSDKFFWFEDIGFENWFYQYYVDAYYKPNKNENFFLQVFSISGAYPDEVNPYYQMATEIEEEYGVDRDIMEVGAGFFPALAVELRKKQIKIGKGTVTIYDPKTIIDSESEYGIKVIKQKFTENMMIKEGSILVGRKPCKATPIIIKNANAQAIETYINLCACNHTPDTYQHEHSDVAQKDMWPHYIENLTKSTLPKNFIANRVVKENPITYEKEIIIKTKRRG